MSLHRGLYCGNCGEVRQREAKFGTGDAACEECENNIEVFFEFGNERIRVPWVTFPYTWFMLPIKDELVHSTAKGFLVATLWLDTARTWYAFRRTRYDLKAAGLGQSKLVGVEESPGAA